jgi:primosomal replication protein N
VALLVIAVGVFGVIAGWHWKLMHRSWQDLSRIRRQAKGEIPVLQSLRSHHTSKALVFAVIVAVLLIAVVH